MIIDLPTSLISVILPAYNTREDFLREAIGSVIAQTHTNWELLVIDDSTVASVEKIVLSYNDERIKYFRNPENIGMAATRNRGLELAKGEFIALLDHDDIWLPEKLAKQLEIMLQCDCNMCYSPVLFIGDKSGKSVIHHNITFQELVMKHNIVSCSCVCLRASLIKKFKLKFLQQAVPTDDLAMWLAVALYGGNIECTDEFLVCYRVHSTNESRVPLACYHTYDWILKDITCKLLKTSNTLSYKLKSVILILRSRAWVCRKLARDDDNISYKQKLHYAFKAILINPIHPQGWRIGSFPYCRCRVGETL